MTTLFYYTGIVVWLFIFAILLIIMFTALWDFYDRTVRPSLGNLRFAIFGKPLTEKMTYYDLWSHMSPWHYRYYTRGSGNKNFSRLAIRRLVFEARKESRRKKF